MRYFLSRFSAALFSFCLAALLGAFGTLILAFNTGFVMPVTLDGKSILNAPVVELASDVGPLIVYAAIFFIHFIVLTFWSRVNLSKATLMRLFHLQIVAIICATFYFVFPGHFEGHSLPFELIGAVLVQSALLWNLLGALKVQ